MEKEIASMKGQGSRDIEKRMREEMEKELQAFSEEINENTQLLENMILERDERADVSEVRAMVLEIK